MRFTDIKVRSWCAVCQFEGKNKFLFGAAVLPIDVRLDEVEDEMFSQIDRVFPIRPKIVELKIGEIFFIPSETERLEE